MKTIGQLMEEMGFRKDAPESLKKAFIQNLVNAANAANPRQPMEIPVESISKESSSVKQKPEQLSFDFENLKPKPEAS